MLAKRYSPQVESKTSRGYRLAFGVVFVAAGFLSVIPAPMSWQLFVLFAFAGIFVGLMGRLERFFGAVGLVLLVIGVPAAGDRLTRAMPGWHAAWWQPIVIAMAAMVAVAIAPKLAAYRRQ